MNRLLGLGLVTVGLLAGCSDSSDDNPGSNLGGSGGSGGSAGAPMGGAGGTSAGGGGTEQGGAAACDPAIYASGNACKATDRCVDGDTVWRCESGGLQASERVVPGPLPASCQPEGTWTLVKGAPTASTPFHGCDPGGPVLPTSVTLAIDTDGSLLSSLGGTFDPATCQLGVNSIQSMKNQSESWTLSWEVRLTFASTGDSGTYQRSQGGFCSGSDEGPLTVTKAP